MKHPPVWLLGLCNFIFGAYFAVMLQTVPQLLSADGVPQPTIARVTAIGMIPTFCSFFLSPILDWRFTRRAYAIALALLSGGALVGMVASLRDMTRLATFMFVGAGTINLYQAALGGWLASIVRPGEKGRLGAWLTIANVGGGGVTAAIAIVVLRQLPFAVGVAILAAFLLAPLSLFPWIPTPAADRRLATEGFRDFSRDVLSLLRRRTVVWTLFLFALPAASFALTNMLAGLGRDFATSERVVGLVTGVGLIVAGVVGSLAVPRLIIAIPPRVLYVSIGTAGALFTFMLLTLARTSTTFALAVFGENTFQSAAFAVESTIVLATIGEGNPLAATQFGLLMAAPSLPITYMQAIDGAAYGARGLPGALVADASLGVAACAVAAMLSRHIQSENARDVDEGRATVGL